MADDYDPMANIRGCFELSWAAGREIKIRSGEIEPRSNDEFEVRWSLEGPVSHTRELDAVRFWP